VKVSGKKEGEYEQIKSAAAALIIGCSGALRMNR